MDICVITNRRLRSDLAPEDLLARAARSGADLLQIREKNLPDAELLRWTRIAVARGNERTPPVPVVVNGRPDVALAAGAAGVQLPADGLPVADVVSRWRGSLRVGASVHSIEEAMKAQHDGADWVMLGPVFDTPSKRSFGAPLGTSLLAAACRTLTIPVYAIGGVNPDTATQLRGIPLGGVAVISAVIGALDMAAAVAALREALAAPPERALSGGVLGVEEVCR